MRHGRDAFIKHPRLELLNLPSKQFDFDLCNKQWRCVLAQQRVFKPVAEDDQIVGMNWSKPHLLIFAERTRHMIAGLMGRLVGVRFARCEWLLTGPIGHAGLPGVTVFAQRSSWRSTMLPNYCGKGNTIANVLRAGKSILRRFLPCQPSLATGQAFHSTIHNAQCSERRSWSWARVARRSLGNSRSL